MKTIAWAPSNIAFIKYWGKYNEKLRLPANSSISMNLSEAYTITSVEFNERFEKDVFLLNGKQIEDGEALRVFEHLKMIKELSKMKNHARIESKNNFPKASGIASSASGFAALTLAASKASGLELSEKELSILSRLGSGSACRSIPEGFVEWKKGKTNTDSYAFSLFPPDYWELYDLIAVVGEGNKKISSTEGHAKAESSPFYKTRIKGMERKVSEIKKALSKKDFTHLGEIVEEEAVNMHSVMMTSVPPLFYWLPGTLSVMTQVLDLRKNGTECYFTIDAGPNVHVICQKSDFQLIKKKLSGVGEVKRILVNKVGKGAHLVE